MSTVDIDSLEPNSYKHRAEKKAKEETERKNKEKCLPVIKKDQIVSMKKPLSKRISESFMIEDKQAMKSWFVIDVLIPGVKKTVLDTISMMFYGETNSDSRRSRRRRNDDRVSYSSYYNGKEYRDDYYDRRSRRRKDEYSNKVDFRNIILRNRDDAEIVIDAMRERIRKEGAVSVADLLDLIDIPGDYTDFNYGWEDERDIGIRRVSSGFLIDVSEPVYLKD